ncbi:NAD-dependent epimerase/dehydratase family protein [Chitinophaga japonensis]|uniref:Nucleoside-diphosphate-sugar epimerase n=1 Tax=Chitinophaga japonensis TaxID=104662 RepID=A0A562TF03_CHIJA|nr:NAD-dependent epimerase/dehydratase family protein [Chitinophaga japonensis]TWI92065.1 nucleoside-diphosphate-sugar epimerase [Chitinophaga japonensis]
MNITIIGGAGFIGTSLIEKLGETGSKYCVIDKRPVNIPYARIADIRNVSDVQKSVEQTEWVILLAAEHQDNVEPISLYYEVNVNGTRNVLDVMDQKGIKKIIFTSSVAVYGLNKENPSETHPVDPFNHYGKSKWQAEEVLREWYNKDPGNRTLIIIRPTVVFGPGNRGNVYNLLKQIATGKFLMIGSGNNKKSMAYVENIVHFLKYCIDQDITGYQLFNYADKPDLSTRELVAQASISLNKRVAPIKIPYAIGYLGGVFLDLVAKIINKKLPISAVRIKKFCATTRFSADRIASMGYKAPFTLREGLDKTIQSIANGQ